MPKRLEQNFFENNMRKSCKPARQHGGRQDMREQKHKITAQISARNKQRKQQYMLFDRVCNGCNACGNNNVIRIKLVVERSAGKCRNQQRKRC